MAPGIWKQKLITIASGSFKKPLAKIILPGLVFVFVLTAVFFCRKPVILVSDRAFTVLYGERRALVKRLTLSLSLFRPIKTIEIAEGAGPDLAAQGAASLSGRPFAVFFPYRYREGARRYLRDRPGSPVVVLGGRRRGPELPSGTGGADDTGIEPDEPLWIWTDTEADLYRAGIFAGLAAQDEGFYNQGIALYGEGLGEAEKTAFQKGLEKQQWYGSLLFSPESTAPPLVCAVALTDFHYNEEGEIHSLILFSWLDPVLAPRMTLAVFDDSPWVQIGAALKILKEGGQGRLIPSNIIVPGGDKTLKIVKNRINRIKTLIYKGENADN